MLSGPTETASPIASEPIRAALAEFQEECAAWQRDVEALFDDLAVELGTREAAKREAGSSERMLEQLDTMGQALGRQSEMAGEMTSLRRLVEQQTELLCALFQGENRPGPPSSGSGMAERGTG